MAGYVLKSWRLAFGVGAGIATVAIACGPGFLDGISGGSVPLDAIDGSSSSSSSSGASDGRACDPRTLPPPPTSGDNQLAVPMPVFAIDSLRVDTLGAADAGGAKPVGLDLDNRCTCPEPDSCRRPADGGSSCDNARGEDNAMASFFNAINSTTPLFEQTFATDRIRLGFGTVLLEVLAWNGQPNDTQVAVTMRYSQHLDAPKFDGGFGPPKFDGNDLWTVESVGVSGGVPSVGKNCQDGKDALLCLGRTRDDNAWVTDGVLVAHPRYDKKADAPVPLVISAGLGPLAFRIFDVALFAKLEMGEDGGVKRMTGELVGRVSVQNMLEAIGTLEDFTEPGKGKFLCSNAPFFGVAKSTVCATPDLSPPGKDNTDVACDHISLSMSFTATPAKVGTIARTEAPITPCDASANACP